MPTTTTINGIQIPILADASNIETAIHPMATSFDSLVISRFATVAARDAAISAPVYGMVSSVSGTAEVYFYNGTKWVSMTPRVVAKSALEQVTSSTVLQSDNELFFTVEANSTYVARYALIVVCGSTTPDIKFNFDLPSGATRGVGFLGIDTTGAFACSYDFYTGADITSGSINGTTPVILEVTIVTTSTAGTATLTWAQNTSDANPVALNTGSYVSVSKVA